MSDQPIATGSPLPSTSAQLTKNQIEMAQRAILDSLGIEVLGHLDDWIFIFSRLRQKVYRLANWEKLNFSKIVFLCGELALQKVTRGYDAPAGRYTAEQVRDAIAYFGGGRDLANFTRRGPGIWPLSVGQLIVNGREVARWRDGRLERLEPLPSPLCEQHLIELSDSEGWVNLDLLEKYLNLASSRDWCQQVFGRLSSCLSNWTWKCQADTDLAAALVTSTWVQTCWPWRPQVALLGPPDSEAACLLDFLGNLFGRLSLLRESPTRAEIRRAVGNSARLLLIDDFAPRQGVLRLLRSSSRAARECIAQGSLNHIAWIAPRLAGYLEGDSERFVILDLQPLAGKNRGKVFHLATRPSTDLGVQLCAVALRNLGPALALYTKLRDVQVFDVPKRTVDAYAVPVAMLAAIRGLTEQETEHLLQQSVACRGAHPDL
jgi:hypothetical protein